MTRKGGASLQDDVPWRVYSAAKPIPKIHYSPIFRIAQNPCYDYAVSVMKLSSDHLISSSTVNELKLNGSLACWSHLTLLVILHHPDPIGSGLGKEAMVEAAGLDSIVPGQTMPIGLLGLKVWPIEVDLKFIEPVGRELKLIGRVNPYSFMDSAVDLMNKSFIDR